MANTYDPSGKTALVTGGTKGIGSAIESRLVASGAKVYVRDASVADSDAVGALTSTLMDVTDPAQVNRDLGPDAVKAMINDNPLKRLGAAEEVAQPVAWL